MKKKTALLICDMMNIFNFPEANKLRPKALIAAKAILKLKNSLKNKKIQVIYVNDNFDEWLSDWRTIYRKCTEDKCPGKEIAEILNPDTDDYFILKPKHSGFHLTALDALLKKLEIKKLIITGIAGNVCVLFTAYDAHMREYEVSVPKDCIACNRDTDKKFTLEQLKNNFKMQTSLSAQLL